MNIINIINHESESSESESNTGGLFPKHAHTDEKWVSLLDQDPKPDYVTGRILKDGRKYHMRGWIPSGKVACWTWEHGKKIVLGVAEFEPPKNGSSKVTAYLKFPGIDSISVFHRTPNDPNDNRVYLSLAWTRQYEKVEKDPEADDQIDDMIK